MVLTDDPELIAVVDVEKVALDESPLPAVTVDHMVMLPVDALTAVPVPAEMLVTPVAPTTVVEFIQLVPL